MAQDFGGERKPAWRRGQRLLALREQVGRIGLVAGFVLFAALPTSMALSGGDPSGGGPPKAAGAACRQIAKAAFERGWKAPPRVIHFQGVAFARRRGDAFCGMGHDGLLGRPFPVCEFDAPVEVGVSFGGHEAWFDVGPGFTAVVEVRPEGPRCAVTGRLGL